MIENKEVTAYKNLIAFFKDKKSKMFLKWLKKDKRRINLFNKVMSVLLKQYTKRLTFDEIHKESKICKRSLIDVLKKLKQLKIITDYDEEKIVHIVCEYIDGKKVEHAVNDQAEKFFYRYKYKLCNLENSNLLIVAIWAICLRKK
jgi:selenocysteine lyase/cysteine desulfurase